ncbi:MAG: hypothetical protein HKN36_09325 [Hellea sp.]|nr:hypothetical protein [Hellea sp.]
MASLMDAAAASHVASWSLSGRNRPVKVLGISARNYSHKANGGLPSLGGFFTLEKYLWGRNPAQLESLLGLRPFELKPICHIYGFTRLPKATEVEFKFSAAWPDGKIMDDEGFNQILESRQNYAAGKNLYNRAIRPVAQHYPPGSSMIPQWRLKTEIPARRIAVVSETIPFARENGSAKIYRPHNRKPIR